MYNTKSCIIERGSVIALPFVKMPRVQVIKFVCSYSCITNSDNEALTVIYKTRVDSDEGDPSQDVSQTFFFSKWTKISDRTEDPCIQLYLIYDLTTGGIRIRPVATNRYTIWYIYVFWVTMRICEFKRLCFAAIIASWWRHQMETFPALLAIYAGNSPVPGEFPVQRPVTRSFDVSLICVWINTWVNNREAGDLRCHHTHYDVIVM